MAAFMTPEWAQACAGAIRAWPGEELKARKLQEFWDWIDAVRPFITGRLALSVADLPDSAAGDTLAIDLDAGTVTSATITRRADTQDSATFLLAGAYADWQEMLAGYDVGKMVMYRKLTLEKGDTLLFFMAAFYWTELLAAIQSVPAEVPTPA
ncbi:MAG: hypothetical protein ACRDNZ_06950 [Streptosporangiaceae bacterium]